MLASPLPDEVLLLDNKVYNPFYQLSSSRRLCLLKLLAIPSPVEYISSVNINLVYR